MNIRDCGEYREKKRRDGTIYKTANGEYGYGPFTWEARQMILERLLKVQVKMNYELITIDELRAIDRIWDEEQDLTRRTLVDLYNRVTGKKLPWDELKQPLYDEETLKKLKMYAKEYEVPMDLVKNMLFKVNKTKYYSNTRIMRDQLSKAVTQQWLQEDALVRHEEDVDNAN